ncbi:uncharacterized protein [Amphiura filiformis]|uniref:uncharacterized protein n=1 Tax=Amphiura filiformis TaxID=82378 RepID=UPI003B228F74
MVYSLIWILVVLGFIVGSSIDFIYPKGLPCKVYNSTELDCSNRELTSIPPLKYSNVKGLDLSHNQLEAVNGKSFVHLTLLQKLDLSYNKILNISTDTFRGLNKLETLDLSYQSHLTFHGTPFYSTTSLKKLHIADSGLSSLPPSVFSGLHELQELDISENGIRLFPNSVFQGLTNLTRLDASSCWIEPLSAALFKDLISLEYLDISYDHIVRVPETLFVNLTSLKHLDISFNAIPNLPETLFANLANLTYLDISHNNLSSAPCKALAGLGMVSTLHMTGNHFDYVTCSIENMTSLEKLNISYNYNKHILYYTEYWDIIKWSELITRLPATLSALNLDVYGNTVFQPVMPGSLNSTVSLLTICDSSNYGYLSVEDDAFSMFLYLQHLSIHSCIYLRMKYTDLYEYSFRGLLQLKSLDLSNAGLRAFPYETLEVLAGSLEYLDLSNNNIQEMYPFWQNKDLGLNSVDISRNPIYYMDLEILGNK